VCNYTKRGRAVVRFAQLEDGLTQTKDAVDFRKQVFGITGNEN
jgi:hypothetical protein